MKLKLIISILTLATAPVFAANTTDASAPKTREQVKAELAEATRTGDIQAFGDSGRKLNELYQNRYPAKPVVQGNTREQVMAELEEAIRTGNILAPGNSGRKLNELYPSRFPSLK